MKNIEKYYDELLNQQEEPDCVCYYNKYMMERSCAESLGCGSCATLFLKWLNEEYKKPITISADEKVILRNLPEEYKYITRDYNNMISIHKEKPIKNGYAWVDKNLSATWLKPYNHLFHFIKWEDDKPYSIEELLKEDTYEPSR